MRPTFRPELVNEAFGNPELYVDFKFEKQALLFDLGDLAAPPPKKILRISDVFVSYTHSRSIGTAAEVCTAAARTCRRPGSKGPGPGQALGCLCQFWAWASPAGEPTRRAPLKRVFQ